MGYVFKSNAGSELLPAIEAVLGGKRFFSRGLERHESPAGCEDSQAHHRHAVLFCSDEAAILNGLTRFIAAVRRRQVMQRLSGPLSYTAMVFVEVWRQEDSMLMPPMNAVSTFRRMSPSRRTQRELSKPSEAYATQRPK